MEPWIGDLEMHPTDAEVRGVRDGDRVRAFNLRGEIVLKARVDVQLLPELLPRDSIGHDSAPAGAISMY